MNIEEPFFIESERSLFWGFATVQKLSKTEQFSSFSFLSSSSGRFFDYEDEDEDDGGSLIPLKTG
jgi:hypothetical protein